MKWLHEFGRALDNGWFSRLLVMGQFYFAFDLLVWSQAFAGTALATKASLGETAAVITATAAVPLGLVTLAVNSYMSMRSTRPVVVEDRRKEP